MAINKTLVFQEIKAADVKSGMIIRVHQKIKDQNAKGEEKERTQIFEGLVLSRKHGGETGATFCVRKVTEGIGVEKTFPSNSPLIEKIELVDTKSVNRSKLYYARTYAKRIKSVKETKAGK